MCACAVSMYDACDLCGRRKAQNTHRQIPPCTHFSIFNFAAFHRIKLAIKYPETINDPSHSVSGVEWLCVRFAEASGQRIRKGRELRPGRDSGADTRLRIRFVVF